MTAWTRRPLVAAEIRGTTWPQYLSLHGLQTQSFCHDGFRLPGSEWGAPGEAPLVSVVIPTKEEAGNVG